MAEKIVLSATATATSTAQPGAGGRPKLQHAWLDLREPPPAKGSLDPGPSRGRIDFQFNPRELTVSKSAKWDRGSQKNNAKSDPPQFKGPDPSKLSVEMFLDASDVQDASVVDKVEQLFACCVPTKESLRKKPGSPPWVIFNWGQMSGFPSYVSSVSVKYTLFTPDGLPIRATATVSIEEISGEHSGQNPTSGALTAQTVHTVVAGDSLPSIAWREYGDPTVWRVIAERNAIDDPMRLPAGTALFIPAAEELGG
jgi:nucleoid-associated protein YgaU